MSIAKALEKDENSTILTQDDENDSHVFSVRVLPFRRLSFSKKHDEKSYLCKQQLKARLLACFEYFDHSHSSPDRPDMEVNRAPEFLR